MNYELSGEGDALDKITITWRSFSFSHSCATRGRFVEPEAILVRRIVPPCFLTGGTLRRADGCGVHLPGNVFWEEEETRWSIDRRIAFSYTELKALTAHQQSIRR